MILELKSRGIEPIVQVPINDAVSVSDNAQKAAEIVQFVNVDESLGIKYWAIGNEPDMWYTNNGFGDYSSNAKIAEYIIACSAAMKAVSGQKTIKIIGPSRFSFSQSAYSDWLGSGANSMVGLNTNFPNQNIYYIDYITFNTYPVNPNIFGTSNDRSTLISKLRGSGGFEQDLGLIKTAIATAGRTNNLGIIVSREIGFGL